MKSTEPVAVLWWRLRERFARSDILDRPFQYGNSRGFFDRLHRLERNEEGSSEEIGTLSKQMRAKVLKRAIADVRYYRQQASSLGWPDECAGVEDLFCRWPLIDKAVVQTRAAEFLADDADRASMVHLTTGGTTGRPLSLWHAPGVEAWEQAFVWRHWRWHGIRFLDRAAICRGRRPASGRAIDIEARAGLVLSGFDLSWGRSVEYVRALQEFGPRYLRAYPSTADLLARRILHDSLRPPAGLRVIFTSSELLLPSQRKRIEEAFQCPVADLYGHAERAVSAGECPAGRLHVFSDYGHLEIVDRDGDPCKQGEVGEIVATAFHNPLFPLIRYRTGDLARFVDGSCPCGRPFPVLELAGGRTQEHLVTPEGSRISVAALNFHTGIFNGIERFRFVQRTRSQVDLEYAPIDPANPPDEAAIEAELRPKLGSAMEIRFVRRADIERTAAGKHRFIVPLPSDAPAEDREAGVDPCAQ